MYLLGYCPRAGLFAAAADAPLLELALLPSPGWASLWQSFALFPLSSLRQAKKYWADTEVASRVSRFTLVSLRPCELSPYLCSLEPQGMVHQTRGLDTISTLITNGHQVNLTFTCVHCISIHLTSYCLPKFFVILCDRTYSDGIGLPFSLWRRCLPSGSHQSPLLSSFYFHVASVPLRLVVLTFGFSPTPSSWLLLRRFLWMVFRPGFACFCCFAWWTSSTFDYGHCVRNTNV